MRSTSIAALGVPMKVGAKAVVQPVILHAKHPGIRFDNSQGSAASAIAPRGASGKVIQVSPNQQECLVELYWNDNPKSSPGTGHVWRIWVQRAWFGQLLVP
jgi:hypothetical protein